MPSSPSADLARRALLHEQRFRRYFLVSDAKQSAVVMIVVSLAFYATARNDLLLLAGTSTLYEALAGKLVHLAVTAAALVLMRRARSPRQLDRATASWLAATAVITLHNGLTRLPTGEFQGPIITQCALICVLWFALRGPVWHRALTGAVISLEAFLSLWNPQAAISSVGRGSGTIAVVALSIIGVISARAFDEQRRKRVEAEHHDQCMRQALAAKVRELAAEKARVEELSRARATFLATMSHEFRTPMNAVIGLSTLLLEAPLATEHHGHVRMINDSARSLLVLLNDILDFAKIDARRLTLSAASFDLRRLAASIDGMLRPAADARGVGLSVDVAPELPAELVGDEARLRQVIVNLVSNAIKFTERGRVRLRITARALGEGAHEVELRVEDTGIGIAPEVLARLFQPFEQGNGGIERRHGGTGLGLAISRQIVVAMGGDIHVESEPGRGSVFSFTLQLAEVVAVTSPAATPAPAADDSPPPLAILVVDDQPINRRVAGAMLERLGQQADLVSDGPEAIEAVVRGCYDVVFMDLHMPGMSGLEAVARIRERLAGDRIPHLVAMTASVFEEDRGACRAAGMADFIGKPIELEDIEAVLSRLRRRS